MVEANEYHVSFRMSGAAGNSSDWSAIENARHDIPLRVTAPAVKYGMSMAVQSNPSRKTISELHGATQVNNDRESRCENGNDLSHPLRASKCSSTSTGVLNLHIPILEFGCSQLIRASQAFPKVRYETSSRKIVFHATATTPTSHLGDVIENELLPKVKPRWSLS